MSLQTKKIIYELEEEDEQSNLNQKSDLFKKVTHTILLIFLLKSIINRKLGTVSYIKWGNLYNYQFSFDTVKGRLLCYKTATSKSPNNYYTIINGQFVDDPEEIQKKEQQYKKKKNYIPPSQNEAQTLYVKTKKGKYFRLTINENENADKIMGYLEMCFSQKNQKKIKAFFALLGLGIIKVNNQAYKLITGILVPLDNWHNMEQQEHQNYLLPNQKLETQNQQESGLKFIASNIPVIGGILAAFSQKSTQLGMIFCPSSQTIDIITFDQTKYFFCNQISFIQSQPSRVYLQLLKLVKKQKNQQGEKGQFMKLKTIIQIADTNGGELFQVGENKQVKIFCRKKYQFELEHKNVQASMFNSVIADELMDEQDEPDKEKVIVAQALEFYRKNLKTPQRLTSVCQEDIPIDDTKEFIIIKQFKTQNGGQLNQQFNQLEQQQDIDDDIMTKLSINDEDYLVTSSSLIQQTRSIQVKMRTQRFGDQHYINIKSNRTEKNKQEDQKQEQQLIEEMKDEVHPMVVENIEIKIFQEKEAQEQQKAQEVQGFQDKEDQNDDDDEEVAEKAIARAGSIQDPYLCCPITGYQNIMKVAREFQFIKRKDEYRVETAHSSGGTACLDKQIVELSRSVGKTMIKEIGRKIISGNFNLTTISFPIKAMIPKSALEKSFMQTILFPLYINRCTQIDDIIERFRLVIVATISNFVQANSFLKPLNPILGETFEGAFEDGTLLFGEQISHHPPVSYFLAIGPQKSYKFWGYSLYEAKAGLNSLTLTNKGKRFIEFNNQQINYTFTQEIYSGTFWGTMKHESQGQVKFTDEKNNITATLTIGSVKKKPSDYVDCEIFHKGKVVSKMAGSYMGFLEFDGNRYWDAREVFPFRMRVLNSQLESDFSYRSDLKKMLMGDLKQAQIEKENLENIQRNDAKLRKNFEKSKVQQEKQENKDKKKKK